MRARHRDTTHPELNSTAYRSVTLVQPCPTGQEFCEDDRACAPPGVSCDLRSSLGGVSEDVASPPLVLLLGVRPEPRRPRRRDAVDRVA